MPSREAIYGSNRCVHPALEDTLVVILLTVQLQDSQYCDHSNRVAVEAAQGAMIPTV